MTLGLKRTAAAALLASLLAAPVPAAAQTDPAPDDLEQELEALSEEARRALEQALERLGPILRNMIGMIDGMLIYEAPRVLPNGDILIPRKRRDAVPPPPDADAPETLDL
jgi:hypothetical protein